MEDGNGRTLSLHRSRGRRDAWVEPHLFLIIQAGRNREAPLRLRLGDVDEVHLGRGPRRKVEIHSDGTARRLRVAVADSWMSSEHAALVGADDGWRLADRGSKNGSLVNGQRVRAAALRDGDVIELGQTFFVFRAALPTPADAPAWLDGGELDALPGLGTMLPELTARFDELARIAASKTSIVIRGSTGTGKELLARAIHQLSGRRGAFLAVNCAGLPETLVESELFGYVRGAFSGADRDRDGLLVASSGGTLFLDEIGDLPPAAQSKLLRALQEQEVRPVGGTTAARVDLRTVAATHRDLDQLVADERFREDLLGRLGGSFALPPLSERREDLGLIVAGLLARIEDPRAHTAGLTAGAIHALLGHAWPRNVRELQKALERAIALAGDDLIGAEHLPAEVRAPARPSPRPATPTSPPAPLSAEDEARRARLIELLRQHDGNVAAVARDMGKVRSQVQRWMKRYGIDGDPA